MLAPVGVELATPAPGSSAQTVTASTPPAAHAPARGRVDILGLDAVPPQRATHLARRQRHRHPRDPSTKERPRWLNLVGRNLQMAQTRWQLLRFVGRGHWNWFGWVGKKKATSLPGPDTRRDECYDTESERKKLLPSQGQTCVLRK
jgi:hypothetical protein